jgi:hypothetical protein
VNETLAEGEAAGEVATASTDNAEVGVPVAGAQGAVTVTIVAALLRGITARAATVAAHNRNKKTFMAENECGERQRCVYIVANKNNVQVLLLETEGGLF